MKTEFDNEIDALLRRNARAATGRVAGAGGDFAAAPPAHLDADELSAFAENALPAAARLSVVSHLADCDACRGVAVGLSRAAGGVETHAAAAPSVEGRAASARGWLAALFSPRVLRFVAPALALCLVGALALVLLRARRAGEGNSVALRDEKPNASRPNAVNGGAADAAANANANASMTAEAPADAGAPQEPPNTTAAPAAPDTPAPSVVAPADESPDGSEGRARDVLSSRAADAVAPEGESAPPPPPRPVAPVQAPPAAQSVGAVAAPGPQPRAPEPREEAKEKKEDARGVFSEEVARVENLPAERRGHADNQQAPDGSRDRSANSALGGGRAASPRREPERTNRSLGGPRARRSEGEDAARGRDEDDAPAAETRSAAGRRFRREGGAWVDVNYRPTMAMTGVRRGTEAYRALVADLPELGRIAEQLGGEVIAVVRGRAYRIR